MLPVQSTVGLTLAVIDGTGKTAMATVPLFLQLALLAPVML
jgi:hypothetical protein